MKPRLNNAKSRPPKPKRGAGSVQRMLSDKQAELAAKISNDIAEGIDCGESRKSLRLAVAYWSDVAYAEAQRRAAAESTVQKFKCAKGLMDAVLSPNEKGQQ